MSGVRGCSGRPRALDHWERRDVRRRYFSREANQVTLAREYGVSQSTVSRVIFEPMIDKRER